MTKIAIDTSIWVELYRDTTGNISRLLAHAVGGDEVAFVPFVATEILQGARDDNEWSALAQEIANYPSLEIMPSFWKKSARIYAELRWKGFTVRSTVDCFIAQVILDHDFTLLHNDNDFAVIEKVRPLKHHRLDLSQGSS